MEIGKHWETIRALFDESRDSCRHFAVATVNEDGSPHIAPIGALFLRDDQTGFYFDQFTVTTTKNAQRNPRVCILAVNSTQAFWRESLVAGEFPSPPAVRLRGSLGAKRDATAQEIAVWQARVEAARGTKGHEVLWKDMRTVRDLFFDSFEPVACGAMTEGLWG